VGQINYKQTISNSYLTNSRRVMYLFVSFCLFVFFFWVVLVQTNQSHNRTLMLICMTGLPASYDPPRPRLAETRPFILARGTRCPLGSSEMAPLRCLELHQLRGRQITTSQPPSVLAGEPGAAESLFDQRTFFLYQ